MASRKYGPGQGANRKGSGGSNMNPPSYQPFGHPDNRFSNTDYSNVTTTPRVVPPPQSALLQTPNISLPANSNSSNLGQYQITVSLNAPGPQGASYSPQGPLYPAPNVPPYQPPVAPSYPTPKGPAYVQNPSSQNRMFPQDNGIHAEAPPPYTPYASKPPPPSYFNQASSSDKNDNLDYEKGFRGRGKGSRMRGHFSQSCGNLNNNFATAAPDSSHKNGQGQGRIRKKGQFNKQDTGSRNVTHSMDEDNDDDSRKFMDQGGSSYQGDRGRGSKRGFHRGRGRGRGGYKDRKDRGYIEHDDDDCSSDDSMQSSGRRYDQDTAFKQRGKGINKSGVHRGRGGDYHRAKMGRRSSNERDNKAQTFSGDREPQNSDKTSSDASGAKPKPFTGASTQELRVSLHFKTCFENAKALKKEIDSTLKNSEGANFEVSYEEILLRHADNEAFCELTISGNSISLAKKNIKQMVFFLKKKLDAFIECKFAISGNDDSVGNEEVHKNKKEKKRDTTAVYVSENKNSRTESASKQSTDKKKSNTPLPVPAVISFAIEKCFSSPKAFKDYLRDVMSSLPFEVQIDDVSISLSAEISKCMINTKSKNDSKKLKQFFSDLQKETEHKMTYNTENPEQPKSSTMLEQKEKALSSMKKKKFVALEVHEEKLTQFVKELMIGGSAKSSSETGNDLEAMQVKVNEAMKQKEEFSAYCDTLYKRLESMEYSTLAGKDISRINSLFDTECNRLSSGLPVYAYRNDIIQCIISNQVSIIIGRSGCGKSTQIVQYLFDSGYGTEGTIVCTQPEGLAAVTLAEKVAEEMNVKVGTSVGFKTSMYTKANRNTKILFATDHSLLEENENNFDKCSCIIVDETHEHSVYTDLLLGMIKSCLPMRQDLKLIIISSSPVDIKLFMKYFKKAPELTVHGRNFQVKEFYTNDQLDDFDNYEEKAVSKACEIHTNEGQGDILVFLSLPAETLRCSQEFEQRFKGEKNFKCISLHNKTSPEELQRALFKELPPGQRKIIFTTKFAETCVSIDGIRYVIDTGMTNEVKYDSVMKVNLTTTSVISQYNAELRKQCAGLFAGGKCYRLYSEESFHTLSQTQAPEILRVHLEKALLKLLDLGVNLQAFEFAQPPSETALEVAMGTLKHYGAIADHQITDAGKWISKLPFDPFLGFLIYESEQNELLYDAVVLAAIVSLGSDLSYRNFNETNADVESRNQKFFGSAKMDAFDWLQVYKHCHEMSKEQKSGWCREKSVNYKAINSVRYSVEEVKSILSKKLNIQMKLEFSCKTNARSSLKKLYMKS